MPRRRPSQVRPRDVCLPLAVISGVPRSTSVALDRLGRVEVSSVRVKHALAGWLRTASLSRSELGGAHNDWTEFIGPAERGELEEAMLALTPRQAAPLRAVVARADDQFRAKTLPNPRADSDLPWWARRWWH